MKTFQETPTSFVPDFERFETIAVDRTCDIAFPIKEKLLIEIVKAFFTRLPDLGGTLLFGGGTSLVCAYDELTMRFSEDADFRYYPAPKSTKKVRQALTEIAESLEGFRLAEPPRSDSHKIVFQFEDTTGLLPQHSALRPFIKAEVFFAKRLFYPICERPVISSYNRVFGDPPEITAPCVPLGDTAIDKLGALLWRLYSQTTDRSRYQSADVRHLHDLVFLRPFLTIDETFRGNFAEVVTRDITERAKGTLSIREVADVVIRSLQDPAFHYAQDFAKYVSEMSYEEDEKRLTYARACENFQSLLQEILAV